MSSGMRVKCTEQIYDFEKAAFVPSHQSEYGTLTSYIEPNSDPGGWMVKLDGKEGTQFFFADELEPVQP